MRGIKGGGIRYKRSKTNHCFAAYQNLLRGLPVLRLLRAFACVLGEKNSYAHHFKRKHGKLYIVGKLNKCRSRKKYKLPVSLFHKRKSQTTTKMTICHSIELIGY